MTKSSKKRKSFHRKELAPKCRQTFYQGLQRFAPCKGPRQQQQQLQQQQQQESQTNLKAKLESSFNDKSFLFLLFFFHFCQRN